MEPYGTPRSPKEAKNLLRNPKDLGSKGLERQDPKGRHALPKQYNDFFKTALLRLQH